MDMNEQYKRIFEISKDAFSIYKEFHGKVIDWDVLAVKARELYEIKYSEDVFARKIMLAYIDELEREEVDYEKNTRRIVIDEDKGVPRLL